MNDDRRDPDEARDLFDALQRLGVPVLGSDEDSPVSGFWTDVETRHPTMLGLLVHADGAQPVVVIRVGMGMRAAASLLDVAWQVLMGLRSDLPWTRLGPTRYVLFVPGP